MRLSILAGVSLLSGYAIASVPTIEINASHLTLLEGLLLMCYSRAPSSSTPAMAVNCKSRRDFSESSITNWTVISYIRGIAYQGNNILTGSCTHQY